MFDPEPFIEKPKEKKENISAKEALSSYERQKRRMSHKKDPETSKQAAASALMKAESQKALVYQALAAVYPDGYTDEQLGQVIGTKDRASGNIAGKRRFDLKDEGLVEDSGQRRQTSTRSMATVWRIVK